MKLKFGKNPGYDPRDAHYESVVQQDSRTVIYDVQKAISGGRWYATVLRYEHRGDDYAIDREYIDVHGYRTKRDATAACQQHADATSGS